MISGESRTEFVQRILVSKPVTEKITERIRNRFHFNPTKVINEMAARRMLKVTNSVRWHCYYTGTGKRHWIRCGGICIIDGKHQILF